MTCPFLACEVINPSEEEPAYIHIDSFDFETTTTEGSDSENITEVWVIANGKNVGIYDLPADVPILEKGDVDIRISAGIKNNGISSTRIIYPFYLPYELTVNLQPFETDTITPSFSYIDGLNFTLESFEDPGIKFNQNSQSDTNMVIVEETELVFEGSGSGAVYLNEDMPRYLGETDDDLLLPLGQYAFAELNYRTNNSFIIGLVAEGPGGTSRDFAVIVNPTNQNGPMIWKKIYVDLGYVVSLSPNAQTYEIYIDAILDPGNTTSELYFDNVKIIHV